MQVLMYASLRRLLISAFMAAILMLPLCAYAQSQMQLSEQKIKAGLIYNFLKYTEWPADKTADPAAPIVVCVFGTEDPFGGYLQPIEERTVNQRAIKLRHINTAAQLSSCHMLFINSDEEGEWPELLGALKGKSVLTVGDFRGFSNAGGMIEFDTVDERIQIWLSSPAVAAARLHIQDSLRQLAKTTHPASSGTE